MENSTFPSTASTGQTNFKVEPSCLLPHCPHCPIHPVTLQNPNPWAIREVPVHVSPGAGALSQGNQRSQWINQTSSELTETWHSARSKVSFSFSYCLSVPSQEDCCQAPQLWQRYTSPTDGINDKIVKEKKIEDLWLKDNAQICPLSTSFSRLISLSQW